MRLELAATGRPSSGANVLSRATHESASGSLVWHSIHVLLQCRNLCIECVPAYLQTSSQRSNSHPGHASPSSTLSPTTAVRA